MLKINNNDWFDLNVIGLFFIIFVALTVAFFELSVWLILLLEVFLMVYAYYVLSSINTHKNLSILINSEKQWSVEINNQVTSVKLKDYWVLSGLILVWLKGDKYSVSFMVNRSIIGAPNFSQLRSKII